MPAQPVIDAARPARLLLWVMAVAVPLFGVVVSAVDPAIEPGLWWRGALSAVAIGLLMGARRFEVVLHHLRAAGVALGLVLFVIFLVRAARSGMPAAAVVPLLLILSLTTSALVRAREVVGLLAFAVAASSVAYQGVDEPGMPFPLMALLAAMMVWGMGMVTVARARAEHALWEVRQELEDRVQQRTEALHLEVEERRAAELQARMADRAKSRFLANMSHELRTPLNAVTGYTEMVREELDDEGDELVGDLDRVLDAAGRLTHMIDDLLDLARIEAGAVELTEELVRVDHVVAEVARLLEPARIRSGARLELHMVPMQLSTDRRQLEQIVLQLVSNALTHAPGGRIVVRCNTSPDGLRLEVHDDGVGIPAADHERIFERFAQLDDSSTREIGGAGLGLALCRDRARRLGGEVGVRSVVGEGSTFWLALAGDCTTPLGLSRPLVMRPAGGGF